MYNSTRYLQKVIVGYQYDFLFNFLWVHPEGTSKCVYLGIHYYDSGWVNWILFRVGPDIRIMTKIIYLQALIDSSMPAELKKNAMRPQKNLHAL